MEDDETFLPFVMELITASFGDETEFVHYVAQRLREEKLSAVEAVELIVSLAIFAGTAISEWADATDRTKDEVMHLIGMDIAQEEE